jgi:hypothetical protein
MEENGQPMEKTDVDDLRTQYKIHIISIAIYVVVASYGLFNIASGHPGVGSWWVILPLFALPPMLHHGVMSALLASGVNTKLKRISITVRIITLVLGILLVAPLNRYASAYAMDRFIDDQDAFLMSLNRTDADICNSAMQYRQSDEGRVIRGAWHKDGDYLVTFYGSSIDIDGSTIYYQKKTNQWGIVHNDILQQGEPDHPLSQAISNMDACEVRVK